MPRTICHPSTIQDYLNDALSPEDEGAVEQHLTDCPVCRQCMTTAAGSGDDWTTITSALRADELDEGRQIVSDQLLWPLTLLGPTDDPRMLGRIGPFEVSGCVGVGGMGVVFKARDPALDRFVAVKVLSPQLAASESARSRFEREARAAAAVVHDNVIAVHQVSEYQGLPYLVMPYLPGPSLEERLRQQGPLAPVEALRIARQVAAGLKAAHAQGLIHRDIKPANILLSGQTERALLTDFGLARAVDDASITRAGALAGTPQFMAPEQARGETTDERSDLFSLGALLFTMLTGRPPVPEASGMETIHRVGSEQPPRLSVLLEDVPRALEQAVSALHCFAPSQRVASAARAESLLESLLPTAGRRPLQRRHATDCAGRQSSLPANLKQLPVWQRWTLIVLVVCLCVAVWSKTSDPPSGHSAATASTGARRRPHDTPGTDSAVTGVTPVDIDPALTEPDSAADGLAARFGRQSSDTEASASSAPELAGSPATEQRPHDTTVPVSSDESESKAADTIKPNPPALEDPDGVQLDALLQSIDRQLEHLENR
ncbi:MAG: protein kinase [Planctomycetaceae bacterium]|nr:protein kinase [Planctomycetaceae bacterium]